MIIWVETKGYLSKTKTQKELFTAYIGRISRFFNPSNFFETVNSSIYRQNSGQDESLAQGNKIDFVYGNQGRQVSFFHAIYRQRNGQRRCKKQESRAISGDFRRVYSSTKSSDKAKPVESFGEGFALYIGAVIRIGTKGTGEGCLRKPYSKPYISTTRNLCRRRIWRSSLRLQGITTA